MSCADYGVLLCGRDAGARWRGTYSDEAGAAAILERDGGAVAALHDGFTGIGWRIVDDMAQVQRGDVVATEIHGRVFGGIWLGERMLLRMEHRWAMEALVRPVAGWRCISGGPCDAP